MLKRLSVPMVGAVLGVLVLATAVWVAGLLLGGSGSAQDLPAVAIGLKTADPTGLPASSGATATLDVLDSSSSASNTSSTYPAVTTSTSLGGGPSSGTTTSHTSQRTTVMERLRVYDPGAGGQHGADAGKQGAGAGR